jgi:hypothetical protein
MQKSVPDMQVVINTQQYIYMFIDKINACKTYICAVNKYYKLN